MSGLNQFIKEEMCMSKCVLCKKGHAKNKLEDAQCPASTAKMVICLDKMFREYPEYAAFCQLVSSEPEKYLKELVEAKAAREAPLVESLEITPDEDPCV